MITESLLEGLIKDSKVIHYEYKGVSSFGLILKVDVKEYEIGLHGTITIANENAGDNDKEITTNIDNIRILRVY